MKTDRAVQGTFVLTMPLRYSKGQKQFLDKQFAAANRLYNSLTACEKAQLEALQSTDEWAAMQGAFRILHQLAEADPGDKAVRRGLKALGKMRTSLLREHGFNKYAFIRKIQTWRTADAETKRLIGTHVAQKIAQSVWQMFERYLYGNGRRITFCSWTECRSIEGQDNKTMLSVKQPGRLYINPGMSLKIRAAGDDYEREALSRRIKYCRLVRIPWKTGWLYKVQLVLEGTPPHRLRKDTLGTGPVGIDIGTQTAAVVSEDEAVFALLAPSAELPEKELRRVNRAMDRSRRANNPQMFSEAGTIVPKDRLPAECLDEAGRRRWKESNNFKRLSQKRRYLMARLARTRRCEHGGLANICMKMGNRFYVEKMNFRALAKRAKPQNPEKGERKNRRKRFGKSVHNRAPAMFIDILEAKVKSHGGTFERIDTFKAKASQYDHLSGEYRKPSLSRRTKTLHLYGKPIVVQRDLYSAFLLMNTNETLNGFDQQRCEDTFEAFLSAHDRVMQALVNIQHLPSSMGVEIMKKAL